MNIRFHYYVVFILSLFCIVSCKHHEAMVSEGAINVIDSIKIYYLRYPAYFLPEKDGCCKELLLYYDEDEYIHSLSIMDSIGISRLSSAIDSLIRIRYVYTWWEDIVGPAVLLIYNGETVDTIGLGYYPGEVQVNGVSYGNIVCKDSLLWMNSFQLIEERDSLWKNSFYGATNPLISRKSHIPF